VIDARFVTGADGVELGTIPLPLHARHRSIGVHGPRPLEIYEALLGWLEPILPEDTGRAQETDESSENPWYGDGCWFEELDVREHVVLWERGRGGRVWIK
jgi:hypothetical protein